MTGFVAMRPICMYIKGEATEMTSDSLLNCIPFKLDYS